jgi:outer membrane protein assembly factor BamB
MAGEMLALDAADGSVVWRFKTAGEPPYFPTGEVLFRPVVAAGNLIFGCRDFRFYGVTATDGRLKWAIWATGWSTSIAADSDTAYGCTSDSHLFTPSTPAAGTEWRYSCPINVFCDPALAGDLLLVGAMNGRLYAYDKARGELRWTFRTQGSLDSEGKILTPWGDWQPEVRARNNSSFPELLASYEALYAEGAILSGPVVGGSRVVFGSSDGRVYALELGTKGGKGVDQQEPCRNRPSVADWREAPLSLCALRIVPCSSPLPPPRAPASDILAASLQSGERH